MNVSNSSSIFIRFTRFKLWFPSPSQTPLDVTHEVGFHCRRLVKSTDDNPTTHSGATGLKEKVVSLLCIKNSLGDKNFTVRVTLW